MLETMKLEEGSLMKLVTFRRRTCGSSYSCPWSELMDIEGEHTDEGHASKSMEEPYHPDNGLVMMSQVMTKPYI